MGFKFVFFFRKHTQNLDIEKTIDLESEHVRKLFNLDSYPFPDSLEGSRTPPPNRTHSPFPVNSATDSPKLTSVNPPSVNKSVNENIITDNGDGLANSSKQEKAKEADDFMASLNVDEQDALLKDPRMMQLKSKDPSKFIEVIKEKASSEHQVIPPLSIIQTDDSQEVPMDPKHKIIEDEPMEVTKNGAALNNNFVSFIFDAYYVYLNFKNNCSF